MSHGCVLVSGGAGSIGSHTCKLLAKGGIQPACSTARDTLIGAGIGAAGGAAGGCRDFVYSLLP
jgi:hypothetical protein